MGRKLFPVLLAACLSVSLLAVGQVTLWTEITATHVTESKTDGVIDWTQGWILATGMAVPPQDSVSEAQGRLQAREAAIYKAYQRLAEIIEGVRVLGVASVRDLILEEDVLEAIVEAEVSKAQIVPELEEWIVPEKRFLFFFRQKGDWKEGEYHVTIQYNFLGELPMTVAARSIEPAGTTDSQDYEATPFTGLIINALGVPLRTTLFLRLVDPDENEVSVVQGAAYVPSAAYQLSLGQISVDRAENDPRVGDHPLAIQVEGIGQDGHSLVISRLNADLVQQILATSKILAPRSDKVIVVTSAVSP